MEQRVRRQAEPILVTDVYEGDFLLDDESNGNELRCTGDTVRFDGPEGVISIPHGGIANVRVDTDRSVAGFTVIGNLFGVASLLMVVAFARTVLSPAPVLSVVGLGSLLAAPLAAYGAVWMRRLEGGERRVLQIDRRDGARTVFVTQEADGAFERIRERIAGSD